MIRKRERQRDDRDRERERESHTQEEMAGVEEEERRDGVKRRGTEYL